MKKRPKPKKRYRAAKGGKKPKIKLPKEQGQKLAAAMRHRAQAKRDQIAAVAAQAAEAARVETERRLRRRR